MCVCAYVCMGASAYVCAGVWRLEKIGCHFSGIAYLFLLLFETRSLTGLELADSLGWPDKEPREGQYFTPSFSVTHLACVW